MKESKWKIFIDWTTVHLKFHWLLVYADNVVDFIPDLGLVFIEFVAMPTISYCPDFYYCSRRLNYYIVITFEIY